MAISVNAIEIHILAYNQSLDWNKLNIQMNCWIAPVWSSLNTFIFRIQWMIITQLNSDKISNDLISFMASIGSLTFCKRWSEFIKMNWFFNRKCFCSWDVHFSMSLLIRDIDIPFVCFNTKVHCMLFRIIALWNVNKHHLNELWSLYHWILLKTITSLWKICHQNITLFCHFHKLFCLLIFQCSKMFYKS